MDEYDIFVITQVRGKAKDECTQIRIIRMYLGYNLFISQKTAPIS